MASAGFDWIFRAFALLVVPVLWHLHIAVGDQFFIPASMGLIRELVPQEALLQANAISQVSIQIGALAGASLGGFIIALWSPMAVMFINSASFLTSCLCLIATRKGISRAVLRESQRRGPHLFLKNILGGHF